MWNGGQPEMWAVTPEPFHLALAKVEAQLFGLGDVAKFSRLQLWARRGVPNHLGPVADACPPSLYLPERQGCILGQAIEADG